ncbi:MAG TPA: TonB-dependent receptor [Bacteroidetes bacterium]|nr:TonB-dependent receptor [Bacteroidota bacterium]
MNNLLFHTFNKKVTLLILLYFSLFCSNDILFGQKAYVSGSVTDKKNGMELIGVNIKYSDSQGTVSDIFGKYKLELEAGTYTLNCSYVGYEPYKSSITLNAGNDETLNIIMTPISQNLKQVVVTAGKFEQELSEITVSMEVLSPENIENINPFNMEDVINQVPGVTINKKQANIRGGSGFSYGAGSRVMVLVDGLPMLSADAGDIKWNMLPMENAEQIEVVKGASSAMYGASALDGVINIRTTPPRLKPKTKIMFNYGMYGDPKRDEIKHWEESPMFGRLQLLHARRIKDLNLVVSTDLFHDQGYLDRVVNTRGKIFSKIEHQPKSIPGLKYGISTTYLLDTGGVFFFWANADSGAYMPSGGDVTHGIYKRLAIDPYISYYNSDRNTRHSFMNRFFQTDNHNINNPDQDALSMLAYSEYQFQKSWEMMEDYRVTFTTGAVNTYSKVKSKLYDDHAGSSNAFYAQVDHKINKVNFSFGTRLEGHQVDTLKREWVPIFRSGLNIQLAEATFLRSSIGQGFRYPSVAERYIKTNQNGVDILPNPDLNPEQGWSSEIGVKQGYQFGEMMGYFDVAGYISQYKEMIEFSFQPPLSFIASNEENSRVLGIELTTTGKTKFNDIGLQYMIGYNFITPLRLDYDPNNESLLNADSIDVKGETIVLRDLKYLKYRNRHTAKVNIQMDYKKVKFGFQYRYRSYMENCDFYLLGLVPGYPNYFANLLYQSSGISEFDANITYSIHENMKVGIFVKNIFNKEYNMGDTRIKR